MNFLHPRYCENTRDEEDTIFAHNHIGVRAENHSAQLTIAEDKIKCSRTKWLRESILTRREHKDLEHTSTGFSTAELGRKEGRKGISKKKKKYHKKGSDVSSPGVLTAEGLKPGTQQALHQRQGNKFTSPPTTYVHEEKKSQESIWYFIHTGFQNIF